MNHIFRVMCGVGLRDQAFALTQEIRNTRRQIREGTDRQSSDQVSGSLAIDDHLAGFDQSLRFSVGLLNWYREPRPQKAAQRKSRSDPAMQHCALRG
jgi:hypothetical protein